MEKRNSKISKMIETERYALSLLEAVAKSENKDIYTAYKLKTDNMYFIVDGYAPDGILDLEGPTIIEVKAGISSIAYEHANNILNRLPNIKKFLFVVPFQIISKKQMFHDKIVIWDKNKIEELSNNYPAITFQYMNKGISNSFKDLNGYSITKTILQTYADSEYNENKEKYMVALKNAFHNDDLSLFLGSGVSIDQGLPSNKGLNCEYGGVCNNKSCEKGLPGWKSLIQRLIIDCLESYDNKYANESEIDEKIESYSNIIWASFIKKSFEEKDLHEKLKEALYRRYDHSIKKNSHLYNISQLCISPRGKTGIYSIVTYNFDDALEFYLKNLSIPYNIIFEEKTIPTNEELPIYHVHGCIPKEVDEELKWEKNSIVFAETEYHSLYKDPYSWQNLIQLSLLKEKTALFVGLSMDDPNLRRLLDIARRYSAGAKHYAILKNRWNFNDKKLTNIFRTLEEKVFEELGVNVIWVEDYSEIDDILRKIKN